MFGSSDVTVPNTGRPVIGSLPLAMLLLVLFTPSTIKPFEYSRVPAPRFDVPAAGAGSACPERAPTSERQYYRMPDESGLQTPYKTKGHRIIAVPFCLTGLAPPAFTAPCRNQTSDLPLLEATCVPACFPRKTARSGGSRRAGLTPLVGAVTSLIAAGSGSIFHRQTSLPRFRCMRFVRRQLIAELGERRMVAVPL
jgi:hypothetical protein